MTLGPGSCGATADSAPRTRARGSVIPALGALGTAADAGGEPGTARRGAGRCPHGRNLFAARDSPQDGHERARDTADRKVAMAGQVDTVLGQVMAGDLGQTLMHEHLLID